MKQLINVLFLLLLNRCQIDPYTHAPTWAGTDWYDTGIQDAISGYAVKDNKTFADNYSDCSVDYTEYLKGYTEERRKAYQQDFIYARSPTGKTFPPSCDIVENVDQLHST